MLAGYPVRYARVLGVQQLRLTKAPALSAENLAGESLTERFLLMVYGRSINSELGTDLHWLMHSPVMRSDSNLLQWT